jgi:hypothetical protein
MNDKSFENHEGTLEGIKFFFFKLVSLDSCFGFFFGYSYHDFLLLFSLSSFVFSYVYFLCTCGILRF